MDFNNKILVEIEHTSLGKTFYQSVPSQKMLRSSHARALRTYRDFYKKVQENCGNFSFWRLRKPIAFARSTYARQNYVNHVFRPS